MKVGFPLRSLTMLKPQVKRAGELYRVTYRFVYKQPRTK